MGKSFNYRFGFYISSVLALIFLGGSILLLLKDEREAKSDDRFKNEIADWLEENAENVDPAIIKQLRSDDHVAIFPGILSDIRIFKTDTQSNETLLRTNSNDTEKENRKINSVGSQKNEVQEVDTDQLKELGDQLNELTESNFELRNKLDSYGYLQFKTESGVIVDYVGELKDGLPHGYGTAIFSSGKRYEGNWVKGEKSGEGIYYYQNNERYEGSFFNNVREGEGTYYFSNGDRYIGSWKNDKRDGQGYILKKNGSITKKGRWKEDKPVK